MFLNKAAEKLNVRNSDSLLHQRDDTLNFSMSSDLFAQFDYSMFNNQKLDSKEIITTIGQIEDFKSLEYILEQESVNGFSKKKLVIKVKNNKRSAVRYEGGQ